MRAFLPGRLFVRRIGPVALVACVGLIVPASAAVNGVLTQLTTASASSSQTTPAISGSLVVWNNASALTGGGTSHDIYWEDLVSSRATQANLTATPDLQEFLEDISGSNVVFTQTSASSAGDILLADLSARQIVAAPVASADPGGAWHYEQPSIGGRYIVFIRAGLTQSDVGGYDTSTGLALLMITNDAAVQASPRVSGDWVVYEDYANGDADVWAYQIGRAPGFPIATGPHPQRAPDVDGTNVVWVESTPGGPGGGDNDQIWLYDLNTKRSRPLTSAPGVKINPRISGQRVVWSDSRNGNLDLYSYDLTRDTEELLTGGAGDQLLGDIDGNRVVFTSNATGFEEVYLFTLAGPSPVVALPFGCDPALTDAADAPVSLSRTGPRVVSAVRTFVQVAGKHYYLCAENGSASGANRTSDVMLVVDSNVVLTSANFAPASNPPHWVAASILDGTGRIVVLPGQQHLWAAALFGARTPSNLTVTLRVAK